MNIAYKNGKFGRIKNTINGVPDVAESPSADQRGELFVSQSTIMRDQQALLEENARKAEIKKARALKIKEDAKRYVEEFNRARALAINEKKNKVIDPDQLKIQQYYSQQMGRTQSENVARSIKADFTNNQRMIETHPNRPIVPRADFQQFQLRGNPLTRDGIQGHTTDFERIVSGQELDNDRAGNVVGGTMLRSVNQMGFSFSDIWDKATESLQEQAEARIETEVTNWLNPQQTVQPVASVPAPRPMMVQAQSMFSDIPKPVLYGAGALALLGVTMLIMKRVKA